MTIKKQFELKTWNEVGEMIKTQRLLEVIKIVDDELAWSISQCIASGDIEKARRIIIESDNAEAMGILR